MNDPPSILSRNQISSAAQNHHEGETPPWVVAVFAYNEEKRIEAALASLERASAGRRIPVYVLVNGCTDRTASVVENYAKSHPWVNLVTLKFGDKANAWNVFVHEIMPPAEITFFIDGDVRMQMGAFDALARGLHENSFSHAAAAFPATGRDQKKLASYVRELHCLMGNLYALRGDWLLRVKASHVKVPIGYVFEDGLLTSLAKWDLDPSGSFSHQRVIPCEDARFEFDSLRPWHPADLRLYCRRRIRYSMGYFQDLLVTRQLRSAGLRSLPASVNDLYRQNADFISTLRPRSGFNAIFDRIALSTLKKKAIAPQS